jgi:hypothetical protein
MKIILIFTALLLTQYLYAQNEQENNPINVINNDDRQVLALNNQQKVINPNISFEMNPPSVDLPQKSSVGSEKVQLSPRSSSAGTSSVGASSGSSAKVKYHKSFHRVSSKGVMKLMDKKVKIQHHYKKKNHIKRCASF